VEPVSIVRRIDYLTVGKIPYINTDSQNPVVARYQVDNLFNLVKMNEKLFFSVFLQFPDMGYGKGRQER
jgi:hypothetical protein